MSIRSRISFLIGSLLVLSLIAAGTFTATGVSAQAAFPSPTATNNLSSITSGNILHVFLPGILYSVNTALPSKRKSPTPTVTPTRVQPTATKPASTATKPAPTATKPAATAIPGQPTATKPAPTPTAIPNPNTSTCKYYVSPSGSDANPGTSASPWRTIQKGADVATAGCVVEILPGTYREAVTVKNSGTSETNRITFEAANGPDTAFVYGSVNSSALTWTGPNAGIYSADISNLSFSPELINELTDTGIVKYPKAHEPDFTVTTPWKYSENWWKAENGTATSLTDTANLSQYGDLTGAVLYMLDTKEAFYPYRRVITSSSGGTVNWSSSALFDGNGSGIGNFTKYYVEGKPQFLDQPTEWYVENGRLYLRPRIDVNPASLNIEIAVRPVGFDLSGKSYVTLRNLDVYFINNRQLDEDDPNANPDAAIFVRSGSAASHSSHVTLDGLRIAHVGKGIKLVQGGAESGGISDHIVIQNSKIFDVDGYAIHTKSWSYSTAGVTGAFPYLTIMNNEIYDIGFRPVARAYAVDLTDAYKYIVVNNYIHDTAHKGIYINSVRGDYVLIKDNTLERTGLNHAEGGGVGTWQSGAIWSKTLVMGNFFKDIHSWSYASWGKAQGLNPGGYSYVSNGDSGFGVNQDQNSGVSIYRNITDNVAYTAFTGAGTFYNNDIYGSQKGIPGGTGSIIKNNIFINTSSSTSSTNNNLTASSSTGILVSSSPAVKSDFGLSGTSPAINAGTTPTEILNLINELQNALGISIPDQQISGSYDIGAMEHTP